MPWKPSVQPPWRADALKARTGSETWRPDASEAIRLGSQMSLGPAALEVRRLEG